MTPLHYAKAIDVGLDMAKKARYEGGFRAACFLDALNRGDWRSAKCHWLTLECWVATLNSVNHLTLEMCKASRMPMHGGETTRYEREEQVFGSTAIADVEPTNAEPSAPVDGSDGNHPPLGSNARPPRPGERPPTSPSYFPPVLVP
jgi:hypothetical protein